MDILVMAVCSTDLHTLFCLLKLPLLLLVSSSTRQVLQHNIHKFQVV